MRLTRLLASVVLERVAGLRVASLRPQHVCYLCTGFGSTTGDFVENYFPLFLNIFGCFRRSLFDTIEELLFERLELLESLLQIRILEACSAIG
jgi:hypothetical protein